MILQSNPHVQDTLTKEFSEIIKEKYCYVSTNYKGESMALSNMEQEVELPDSNIIKLSSEKIRCTEILFEPSINNVNEKPIHDLIQECINSLDLKINKELYSNIYLSGGNTLFEGFQERLTTSLETLISNQTQIQIIAPIERKYSIWIGGSILTSLDTFKSLWITSKEYQECGQSIIFRKSF